MKEDTIDERPRRREAAGTTIARLATAFVMACVIATLIMLVGK